MNTIVLGNYKDWLYYSYGEKLPSGVCFINSFLPERIKLLDFVARFHYSRKINNIIELPLKGMWYNYFFNCMKHKLGEIDCLLIYDWNILSTDFKFLYYIKEKIPKIKICYFFTNIVELSYAKKKGALNDIKKVYDIIFTYDFNDAKKYGFVYNPNIYTKKNSMTDSNFKVFFVGQSKNRLDGIHKLAILLNKLGFNIAFYVTNVSKENQLPIHGVFYNQIIPYKLVLDYISNCNCIVDIIQNDSSGLTLKVAEAVVYGKKLITNNSYIRKTSLYCANVFIIDDISNIDENCLYDFLQRDLVSYPEKSIEYFALDSLLKKIENYDL